ncbi:MAG: OsmC family protein [Roseiflexaceae bacterium]
MWSLPEYLRRKREKVLALRERLRAPTAAAVPLLATATIVGGSGVRPVRVREFTIITDAGTALGGYELGPTAPELLLSALASCLAHSYAIAAADREVAFESLEVVVRGQIDYRGTLAVDPQATIAPTNITFEARFRSAADDQQIALVHADVERLCPVLQALRHPQQVHGQAVRVPAE